MSAEHEGTFEMDTRKTYIRTALLGYDVRFLQGGIALCPGFTFSWQACAGNLNLYDLDTPVLSFAAFLWDRIAGRTNEEGTAVGSSEHARVSLRRYGNFVSHPTALDDAQCCPADRRGDPNGTFGIQADPVRDPPFQLCPFAAIR